jgi:hypothetical protein
VLRGVGGEGPRVRRAHGRLVEVVPARLRRVGAPRALLFRIVVVVVVVVVVVCVGVCVWVGGVRARGEVRACGGVGEGG